MVMADEQLSYGAVLERIGELADRLVQHSDPDVAGQVAELLDWIDAFHRDGLGRLVEMIRQWRGETFLETVAADDITGMLLAAYGLGDGRETVEDALASVEAAIDEVRPLVESHGGAIEVDSVADGVVKVRMHGTCDGCPSSAATLTLGVEQALRDHWIHFRRLELLDPATAIDPAKADLTCVTVPDPVPVPQAPLLQIRGHEIR